uniref:KH domain-containing protein n=1 Tax=Macrostomum lignano TaxID=282301 RepID=A0A1I8J6A4_9PLAT
MSPEPQQMARSPNSDGGVGSPATLVLTIRMLMSGKEVGSIIGRKGDNVKRYREESGARINISDGSCPERIVTVTGTAEQIHAAFAMMCQKFEDDFTQSIHKATAAAAANSAQPAGSDDVTCPPVTLRLLVAATQCGSIIGKGGCKIKEIRELTGASIQVASEALPNSSERTVTISGTARAIAKCIKQLCHILLDAQAGHAHYADSPAQRCALRRSRSSCCRRGRCAAAARRPLMQPPMSGPPIPFMPEMSKAVPVSSVGLPFTSPLTGDALLANGCLPAASLALGHPALAGPGLTPARSHQGPAPPAPTNTQELVIPNDLIGCIIGRGGTKINEIRQLSGAQIKISNCEDGAKERKVTITGTPDTISAAQYLISASIDLHKHLLALNMAVSAGLAPAPPMPPPPPAAMMLRAAAGAPPPPHHGGLQMAAPPAFIDLSGFNHLFAQDPTGGLQALQFVLPPQHLAQHHHQHLPQQQQQP